jgi:hypothetical protein
MMLMYLCALTNELDLLTTLQNDFIIHQDLNNNKTTNFTYNDNSITWNENSLFASALTKNVVYISGGLGLLIALGYFFSNVMHLTS